MILIAGTIDLDPAKRDDAVAAIRVLTAATVAEPGCLHYAFSADLDDPGRFHIAERWVDETALKSHFASPHMAEFQAAAAGLGIRAMDAMRYEIASVGPVFG